MANRTANELRGGEPPANELRGGEPPANELRAGEQRCKGPHANDLEAESKPNKRGEQ